MTTVGLTAGATAGGANAAESAAASNRAFASTSVARTMSLTLQTAAVMLLLLNAATVSFQSPAFPAWWTISAVAALAVPAVATLVIGVWGHPRVLQWLGGSQAVAYLLVLFAVPIALGGHHLPSGWGLPWPAALAVIAGSGAAVTWGFRGALAYGIALQGTVFALVFVASGDPVPGLALSDAVFGVFYVTLFTILAVALRVAGVVLDRTTRDAIDDARAAASAEATRSARRRVASLIHDSVIVALLTYSTRSSDDVSVAAEAQRALNAIHSLDVIEPPRDRSPLEFVWELQALTTEHDPEASFDYRIDSSQEVPAHVVEALSEATAEALRNSVRHGRAVAGVQRAVRATVSDHLVDVVILDDGEGFDVANVSPTRLGIRHGIVARLEEVERGSAQVTSRAGYGTVVALRWVRS